MANEITIQDSIQIKKGNLEFRSAPSSFKADLDGSKGPTPGALTATPDGIDVDLSELNSMGGMCRIMNLDSTNFVSYGIREPDSDIFLPLGELLAGEFSRFRLSRYIEQEFQGTGTGTGTTNNKLHIKSDTDNCEVIVEAFDK